LETYPTIFIQPLTEPFFNLFIRVYYRMNRVVVGKDKDRLPDTIERVSLGGMNEFNTRYGEDRMDSDYACMSRCPGAVFSFAVRGRDLGIGVVRNNGETKFGLGFGEYGRLRFKVGKIGVEEASAEGIRIHDPRSLLDVAQTTFGPTIGRYLGCSEEKGGPCGEAKGVLERFLESRGMTNTASGEKLPPLK